MSPVALRAFRLARKKRLCPHKQMELTMVSSRLLTRCIACKSKWPGIEKWKKNVEV